MTNKPERKHPLANCPNCPYKAPERPYIPFTGDLGADVAFIGENPVQGQNTAIGGNEGVLLNQTIKQANTEGVSYLITNCVACVPNHTGKPKAKAVECCKPRLEAELAGVKTVVPLGAVATNTVFSLNNTPPTNKINSVRGIWVEPATEWVTYTLDSGEEVPVPITHNLPYDILPTNHPNYMFYKPTAYRGFRRDIKKALNGRISYPCSKEPKVNLVTTVAELEEALDAIPSGLVAFDVEADSFKWWYDKEGLTDLCLMLGLAYEEDKAIIIPDFLLYGEPVPPNYPNIGNAYFNDIYPYIYEEGDNDTPSFYHDFTGAKEALQRFFNRADIQLVAHNAKFDVNFLRAIGYELEATHDTMLMYYVLEEESESYGLKDLATEFLGLHDYEGNLLAHYVGKGRKKKPYSNIPLETLALYCSWDNTITLTLAKLFLQQLEEEGLLEEPYLSLIMPSNTALTRVEAYGLPLDVKHLSYWKEEVERYLHELKTAMINTVEAMLADLGDTAREQLVKKVTNAVNNKVSGYPKSLIPLVEGTAKFNPNSTYQVALVIYDLYKVPIITGYGIKARSTSFQAITRLIEKYPRIATITFIELLQLHRRVVKIKNSYIDTLLEAVDLHGYLHPKFFIHGTEIGRLSAREPAVQTIPRPYSDILGAIIRSSISAKEGYVLIDSDFSQAELRVAGVLSGDSFLMDVYNTGRDLHSETALAIYGEGYNKEQRTYCKNLNFADLYGGGVYSFASQANLPLKEASELVAKRQALMNELTAWKEQNFITARTKGKVINPFGRVRRYPLIVPDNLDEVRKTSTHMLVSSTASDLNLLGAIELVKMGVNVVLLVHDSIICEVPEEEAETMKTLIRGTMLEVAYKYFPNIEWGVDSDIVTSWASKPLIVPAEYETEILAGLKVILENDNLSFPINLKAKHVQPLLNYFDTLNNFLGKNYIQDLVTVINDLGSIQLWGSQTLKVN